MEEQGIQQCQKPVISCDLVVTESCMLRCRMCRMWQSRNDAGNPEITDWKKFIDSFAGLASADSQVQFVGGEPLAGKGVIDLIRHTASRGFSTTMTTNAFLIDERMAEEILDSGLKTLVVSLDGIKRQTHDFLRGLDGVYDRVLTAIDLFSRRDRDRLRLHIVTTIMGLNLDELVELAEWANRNSAVDALSFQAVMQPFFTPPESDWHKKGEFSFLWPEDNNKTDGVLDELSGLKKSGYKITNPVSQFEAFKAYFRDPGRFVRTSGCNLGYNSISVNTAGKIHLCLSLEPIGDIRDARELKEMWFSEKAFQVRENIKTCRNNCKSMINCFFEEETAGKLKDSENAAPGISV